MINLISLVVSLLVSSMAVAKNITPEDLPRYRQALGMALEKSDLGCVYQEYPGWSWQNAYLDGRYFLGAQSIEMSDSGEQPLFILKWELPDKERYEIKVKTTPDYKLIQSVEGSSFILKQVNEGNLQSPKILERWLPKKSVKCERAKSPK
jgi:hypothetical protein